jgi:hypothetical protein
LGIINYAAFSGTAITNIKLPTSVTSIGPFAFNNTDLTDIKIPTNVTTISDYAFGSCSFLETITFEGTMEQWNNISKGSSWNFGVPATEVVCSDGVVSLS